MINNIIILGIIINLFFLCYEYYLYHKINKIKFYKIQQIEQKQKKLSNLEIETNNLNVRKKVLEQMITQYKQNLQQVKKELTFLHEEQNNLKNELLQKQLNIQEYYKLIKKDAEKAFNNYEEKLNQSYQQIDNKYNNQIQKIKKQRDSVQTELNQLKQTYQTAAAAQIKEKEKEDEWKFYSIHLSNNEITDITKLQKWKEDLYDPSIVGKIIWSSYIIKPTNDLCSRVLGTKKICGIYKLTNKATNKIYIGQSVDIANRWKTHIKCGLGVDTPPASANKLYKAMQNSSLSYWTFELLEECSTFKLNEREKYWIDFYQSDKIGYNGNKGIKNANKD